MTTIEERLIAGETVVHREKGNSMLPIIKSGQAVLLEPVQLENVKVGDIVLCKVKGRRYTHKVVATGDRGIQIANNRGRVNGWTRTVYGRFIGIA